MADLTSQKKEAPAVAAPAPEPPPTPAQLAARFNGDPLAPNPELLRKVAREIASGSPKEEIVRDWAAAFLAIYS